MMTRGIEPPDFVKMLQDVFDRGGCAQQNSCQNLNKCDSGTKCHTYMSHFRDNESQSVAKTEEKGGWHDICRIFDEANEAK